MSVAVKGIKRQHLVENLPMANPSAVVKLALESICLLLEENGTDWKQIPIAMQIASLRHNFEKFAVTIAIEAVFTYFVIL